MKLVVLDGYTENPGDLSWDALKDKKVLFSHNLLLFQYSQLCTRIQIQSKKNAQFNFSYLF